MSIHILGISAYYHDSAAALLANGQIIAAAQEERFTRKKHDQGFPRNAILYCLKKGDLKLADINYIVFYDKPLIKFERLLETYLSYAPKGLRSFIAAMPTWIKEKLFLKSLVLKELALLSQLKSKQIPRLLFTEHHQAHAASAFFPSPFDMAGILCLDGVGEWATTSVWLGQDNKLSACWELDFPHSLGLLYSAFTYYTGFKVNSGEYKLMGLAPYGQPKYVDRICENLIDVKRDGTFRLNMDYFNYAVGLTMTNKKFDQLFGGKPRQRESKITQKEMNIARSIQVITEEIVFKLAKSIKDEYDTDYLCLAGGVALNCVANGKLLREKLFKDIWVQPAAGDAGGAIGAAYSVWYEYLENKRLTNAKEDEMKGAYLGPEFSNKDIIDYLASIKAKYEYLDDDELLSRIAKLITEGNVVGWFHGRMEFGPRALGARSILGDPRNSEMQAVMNLKIKYRESFRPFAPVVKFENVSQWFDIDQKSPYMLFVADIHTTKRMPMSNEQKQLFGIDKLKIIRSHIPAVTHVDYSARIQTVHKETNPRFWKLLDYFEGLTGCPVLINTSFNVRGEPIVCTPDDAYQCFMRTEMDYLMLGNVLLDKRMQCPLKEDGSNKAKFELD
jgi:carbamoyltransferase